VYKYDPSTKTMVSSNTGAYITAGASSTGNYTKMFSWTGNLFAATFS